MADGPYPKERCSSPPCMHLASPARRTKPFQHGRLLKSRRRKRAAMACRSCRSRKVRCDVTNHGIPCCNCKFDQKECIIPERRRKPEEANPPRRPLTPISIASPVPSDWSSPSECTGANHLLQFIQSQQPDSQSAIDDQMLFSRTGDATHDGNWRRGSSSTQNSSFLMPEDPEVSRWLNVMPPRTIEKFRLYFEKANEDARGMERSLQKPELGTLSRLQQAVDVLEDVVTICKSTRSNEGLISPPPDNVFDNAGDMMDKSSETGASRSFGTQNSKSVSPYSPTKSSITESDSEDWNHELTAELFCFQTD